MNNYLYKGEKKMKKTILILLTGYILFAFAGCDGDKDEQLPDLREPTASAGVVGGNTITPPAYPTRASLTLSGSGEGYDSEVVTYTWTMKSNPDGVLGTSAPVGTGAQVVVNDLRKAGQYTFVFTVARPNGMTKTDEVTVTVEPWVVTKDVTVTFPVFVPGQNLNFVPTYDPEIAGDGFENGDVTYTLEDDLGRVFPSGIASADLYEDSDMPVFTQIFKLNDVEVGRQRIKAAVSEFFEKNFDTLHNADTNGLLGEIPSIELNLEKEVTEVP